MRVQLSLHGDDALLTVTGDVGTVDVPVLRGLMVDAFEKNPGDVLLDVRQARSVSDHLVTALTANRALARRLRRRIVVVDGATGATTRRLRRLGLQFQIPVYDDPAAALAGVRTDREARARRALERRAAPPSTRLSPSVRPAVPPSTSLPAWPDDCWDADLDASPPPARAARALRVAAPNGPSGPGGRP